MEPPSFASPQATRKPSDGATILDLIAYEVQSRPDAEAICSVDRNLSYGELDTYSTRLAAHLLTTGLKREQIILCRLRKSVWSVVCLLSILKAGLVYVPVDPSYPVERVEAFLQQTKATVLLECECYDHLQTSATSLRFEGTQIESLPQPSPKKALPPIFHFLLAYVYFTSGSTGQPKGVMLDHRAMVTSLAAHTQRMGMTRKSRVLQATSYTFDPSITEIFGTLICGGCVCIPRDHADIVATINRHSVSFAQKSLQIAITHESMQVNWAFFTPSVISLLDPLDLPTLKTVSVGGEALTQDCIDQWAHQVSLYNSYGPTEACIFCLVSPVEPTSSPQNIGHATGCQAWIVNPSDHNILCSPGEVGELVIEGDIVARGYLNDQDKTASVFLEGARCPAWAKQLHLVRRFYKTGDLASVNPDGSVSCFGRKDRQIKVRGQRVEPGEIEIHIKRCDSGHVRAAVVDQVQDQGVGKAQVLAAFLLWTEGEAVKDGNDTALWITDFSTKQQCQHLADELRTRLPAHMIPDIWIPIRKLPQTTSGKADRNALLGIAKAFLLDRDAQVKGTFTAEDRGADTAVEALVRAAWASLLDLPAPQIRAHMSFAELGGNSLLAIRFVAMIRRSGFTVSTHDVLGQRSLVDVASSMQRQTQLQASPDSLYTSADLRASISRQCDIGCDLIEDVWRCTPFQESLATTLETAPGSYTARYVFSLPSDTNLALLQSSWAHVESLFPLLRSRLVHATDGSFLQASIAKNLAWGTFSSFEEAVRSDTQEPMALGKPLSRYSIILDDDDRLVMMWTLHHTIYDGWSIQTCLQAVAQTYAGRLPTISDQASAWASFVNFSRTAAQSPVSRKHWMDFLEDCSAAPFPPLPFDGYKPVHSESTQVHVVTPPGQSGVPVPTLIRAAWALAVSKYTASSDITFGEIRSGRTAPVTSIDELVGPTLATIPIRILVQENMTCRRLLDSIQDVITGLESHEHYGIQAIRRTGDGAKAACQFQTMLVIQMPEERTSQEQRELFGTPAEHEDRASCALALECHFAANGVLMEARFDDGVISLQQVQDLLQLWRHLVEQLAQAKCQPMRLQELSYLSAEDESRLRRWNEAEPPAATGLLHDRISMWAKTMPAAVAVQSWDGNLTYQEYDQLSSNVARFLLELNPGKIVCLHLFKGLPLVICMAGILKAGRAFLPLDVDAPAERIRGIVDQLDDPLVLVDAAGEVPSMLNAQSMTMTLAFIQALPPVPDGWIRPEIDHRDLAYMIMTSGSTGKPKGVMLEHSSLITSIEYHGRFYGLNPTSRILQFASISFDAGVGDVLAAIAHGCCLIVPDHSTRLEGLVEFINQTKPNWSFFTPSVLRVLHPEDVPSIETIVSGGEALTSDIATLWASSLHLINGYGPSETTIACAAASVARDGSNQGSIGRGLGCLTWVVDPSNHDILVPIGAVGELVIQGAIVGRGYFKEPQKTASVFISDPKWATVATDGCGRMYKTGDLVRYDTGNGNLVYVGRKDSQVKIRGQRLELGEVEHHLQLMGSDRHGLCFAPKQGVWAGRLIAVLGENNLVPSARFQPDAELAQLVQGTAKTVRERMAVSLPSYMVPEALTLLKSMPVNSSGKLDRKVLAAWIDALPEEEASRLFSRGELSTKIKMPATEDQKTLHRVWCGALRLDADRVGIDQSFSALGGDSISAMQALARCRNLGFVLTMKEMLKGATIESIATSSTTASSAQIPMAEATADAFGLSPIQDFYASLAPTSEPHTFNQSVYLRPTRVIDYSQLQSALDTLAERHAMLRAKFDIGTRTQKISATTANAVKISHAYVDGPEEMLETTMECQTGLDIAKGPLLQAVLMTCKDSTQTLFMTAHHLVVDLVSWHLLVEDLNSLLASKQLAATRALPFQSFCQRPSQAAIVDMPPAELEFWNLAGKQLTYAETARYRFSMGEAFTPIFLSTSHQCLGTTATDLSLAALLKSFQLIFGEHRKAPPICLEGHGRSSNELDASGTVGWFTTIMPVQVSIAPKDTEIDVVRSVKDTRIRAEASCASFLASCKHPGSRGSIPEVTFNFTGSRQRESRSQPDHERILVQVEGHGDMYDISGSMNRLAVFDVSACVDGEGRVTFEWLYPSSLQASGRVQKWANTCARQLEIFAAQLCQAATQKTLSDFPHLDMTYTDLTRMTSLMDAVSAASAANVEVVSVYPASPLQQTMLKDQESDTLVWRPRLVLEVTSSKHGHVDIGKAAAAWHTVVAAYPILRTIFLKDVRQAHDGYLDMVLDRFDDAVQLLPTGSHDEPMDQTRSCWQIWEPQHRMKIRQRSKESIICSWEVNHALIDHASMPLILDTFSKAYEGVANFGHGVPYADYVTSLSGHRSSPSIQYWRDYLQGASPSQLSGQQPKDQIAGARETLRLAIELGSVEAHLERANLAAQFRLAWALVLCKHLQRQDVVFGHVLSGRDVEMDGIQDVVGPVINFAACRVNMRSGDMRQLLHAFQEDYVQSLPHQQHFLSYLLSQGMSSTGLFDTMVNFRRHHKSGKASDAEGALRFTEWAGESEDPFKYDVVLEVDVDEAEIQAALTYWSTSVSTDLAIELSLDLRAALKEVAEGGGRSSVV